MTLLTEEVKSWVGREVVYEAPEELGRASIRYFALAVGDDNPLYIDEDYARANGYPTVIAPPTLVCETNQFMRGSAGDRNYLGHTWDLPVSGTRLIRGGNEYTFFRPVLPTDRITARWKLAEIEEKTSSNGVPMLVAVSEATYTDQNLQTLAINRETLIYQAVGER